MKNTKQFHRVPLFSVITFFAVFLVIAAFVFMSFLFHQRKPINHSTSFAEESDTPLSQSLDSTGIYVPIEGDYSPSDNAYTVADYLNCTVLTAYLQSGSKLSIGVISSDTSGLILNPVYECIEDEKVLGQDITQFAFYISGAGLAVSCSSDAYGFASDPLNYHETSLFVADRTYDTLCPAAYRSNNDYGIKVFNQGFEKHDFSFSLRIIRIPDGALMGIAKLDAEYDLQTGSFRLKNLECLSDDSPLDLSKSDRESMIRRAISFIENGTEKQSFVFALSNNAEAQPTALIEKSTQTYFPMLYNAESEAVSRGRFNHCDIYAVNINRIGCGFYTVYFAPQMQLWGLSGPINPNTGDIDLQILGYDPLFPFSKDEIAVISEDRNKFGL